MEEAYFYFCILLSFTASDGNENLFWKPRNYFPIFAVVKLYFSSYHIEKDRSYDQPSMMKTCSSKFMKCCWQEGTKYCSLTDQGVSSAVSPRYHSLGYCSPFQLYNNCQPTYSNFYIHLFWYILYRYILYKNIFLCKYFKY